MENINNIDGTERISEELASYLKRNKIKASDLNLKTLKRLNQVDMYISNKKDEIKNIINKLITCEFSTKDFTSVIGLNRTSIYKKNKTNDNNIVINYLTEKNWTS